MKQLPEQVEIVTLPAPESIAFSYCFLGVRSYTGPNHGDILVLGPTSTWGGVRGVDSCLKVL